MLEPAPKARNHPLLVGAATGCMIRDGGEVGALSATQATDQGDERLQMAFLMPRGMWLITLHERPLYGTIAILLANLQQELVSGTVRHQGCDR